MSENAKKLKRSRTAHLNGSIVGVIKLTQGKVAIVDVEMLPYICKWTWFAFQAKYKWYARTSVKSKKRSYHLSMHRLIAKTPSGLVCHHKNGNSLDNRKSNLTNMQRHDHENHHRIHTVRWKYAEIPGTNPP